MAEHHPLGDIEYLQYNLLNSYLPGFPILKELVQNAEDAKATRLDYGWIQGIPDATHPLLRSPALFMLDNGKFTEKNAEAIRYILGGSSKPGQQDSIGKFGLGLKSVFHLCEAFFYVAPKLEKSRYSTSDIFNPWAGANNKDKYHEGWDDFTGKDSELMQTALQAILKTEDYKDKCFILWIPLRQPSHRSIEAQEDTVPTYIKEGQNDFFGESSPDFLKTEETRKQLIILTTLLETINQINYWENDYSTPQFSIRVEPSSERRLNFSKLSLKPNRINLIKGVVYQGFYHLDFAGYEIISDLPEFDKILERSELPKKFKNIKPHNAVIFSRLSDQSPDNQSSLTLRTAVFLPVGEDQILHCQSKFSYYLTLHGYFFVDFARTGILGWNKEQSNINKEKEIQDDDKTILEKEWNFYLYKAILNQLLENFSKFITEYSLPESEISAICKALLNSNLLKHKNNRQEICKDKEFIYCVSSQGQEWKLLDRGQTVLPLPEVQNPELLSYFESSSYLLTSLQSPNLRLSGTPFDKWDSQKIIGILTQISESNTFKKYASINYLASFLKECCPEQNVKSIEVQKHLVKFFINILSNLNWNELKSGNSETKRSLQNLIYLINKSNIVYLDVNEEILKHLLKIELQSLLLPESLFDSSSNRRSQKLNSKDAIKVLLKLDSWIKSFEQQNKKTSVLEQLLRKILYLSKNDVIDILSQNQDLSCLIASQYSKSDLKTVFCSYNQFKELKRKSILFNRSNNDLLEYLVEATSDIFPVIVDEEITTLIKKDENISPVDCDYNACQKLLAQTPSLAQPEKRKQLLINLLNGVF